MPLYYYTVQSGSRLATLLFITFNFTTKYVFIRFTKTKTNISLISYNIIEQTNCLGSLVTLPLPLPTTRPTCRGLRSGKNACSSFSVRLPRIPYHTLFNSAPLKNTLLFKDEHNFPPNISFLFTRAD